MNQALTQKWSQLRGLVIVSVAMNPITLPEEDAQMIKEAQRMAILRNPAMQLLLLQEHRQTHEDSSRQRRRCHDRFHGHEHGRHDRRF